MANILSLPNQKPFDVTAASSQATEERRQSISAAFRQSYFTKCTLSGFSGHADCCHPDIATRQEHSSMPQPEESPGLVRLLNLQRLVSLVKLDCCHAALPHASFPDEAPCQCIWQALFNLAQVSQQATIRASHAVQLTAARTEPRFIRRPLRGTTYGTPKQTKHPHYRGNRCL